MPLVVTPVIDLPDISPGPNVQLTIDGINKNLVPDPQVTSTTIWPGIFAGGSSTGVAAPTVAAWSRQTSAFASSPASIRAISTGAAMGTAYVTPFIQGQAGQIVSMKVSTRVTISDGRLPRMRIAPRDSLGNALTPGIMSFATTVSGSFVTQQVFYTLPANTVDYRVTLTVEGTVVGNMTVYFDDLEVIHQSGATAVSVSRVWEGNEESIQAGFNVSVVGSTMFFIDYGVPFGVDVLYRVSTWGDGVLKEFTQSSVIQVNPPGGETVCWISNAMAPELSCRVTPDRMSFKTRGKSRDGTAEAMVTRPKKIAITGPLQEADAIPLSFLTYTNLQKVALDQVLMNTDPILIRSTPSHLLPGVAFITTSRVEEAYIDAPEGDTCRTSFVGALVEGPAPDILMAVRTYQDWIDNFSSYNVLPWASYLEGLRG